MSIQSPCIRHCTLSEHDICLGCFRSLDEILQWRSLSDEQRQQVLQHCASRQKKYLERILHSSSS
ncbi:DUF1289 domain-containing protein [Celerinatantimonas sp. YJH-8]|uniref:DUF1289 domain-containing protein n=1 Tax=Celerinatantimonas sp. YJH-8 TaxID=3228714 RepID=UPI0038C6E38A